MTDTNQVGSSPLKQKISAIIFLVIIILVVWQVIGFFRGGSSDIKTTSATPTPPSTPAKTPMTANGPASGTPSPSSPTLHASGPAMKPAGVPQHSSPVTQSPILSKPTPEPVPPTTPLSAQQAQEQTKYVSAVNELQMLKIQKEIAETNQAIVTAKLATVTAEKTISDTLTPPTPANTQTTKPQLDVMAHPSASMEVMKQGSYVVYSVSMELDQWHAIIGYKDKYYNVTVGDVLPTDGSTVSAIDQKGVTLQQGGMEQRIPLSLSDIPSSGKSEDNKSSGGSSPMMLPPAPAINPPTAAPPDSQ